MAEDPRIAAVPDIHGHAKGEHKPFAEERPIPYTARMLFLWFYHACKRGSPRFLMVADHINYLTFEDPAAVNLVRRALKLAQAGDLYGAAETAGVELGHAAVVSEGLRKGMRYSIGAEIDNDPRSRPDAQNIVDAMRPDGMIRSVHFLPIAHPQHGENWMWAFDNPEFRDLYDVVGTTEVWERYMAILLEAIEKQPGNIVGHFYVPAKFGHWPENAVLERYEDQLLAACSERGMAIEVNSRTFYKHSPDDEAQLTKYAAAYVRLLRKAKLRGVMIAVGSDAHSPRDQGGAFDRVLAILDEADINEIAFPINGRLARVALRATEEILRQHATAALPAAAAPARSNGSAPGVVADASVAVPLAEEAVAAHAGAASDSAGTARQRPAPPRRSRARIAAAVPSGAEHPASAPALDVPHESAPVSTGVPVPPKEKTPRAPREQGGAKPKKTVVVAEPPKKRPSEKAPRPAKAARAATPARAPGKASATSKAAAPSKAPAARKKAAAAKPAARKATSKPAAKKTAIKKAPPKKAAPARKAVAKSAPKRSAARPVRKAAAKKAVTRRPAAPKRAAPAAKRTAAKHAPAKKGAAKKARRR